MSDRPSQLTPRPPASGPGATRPAATARIGRRRFTLLETLVVLVIIATVVSIAVPRLGVVPTGLKVRQTLNTMRTACHSAGSQAVCRGRPVTLHIDFERRVIELRPAPGGSRAHRAGAKTDGGAARGSIFRGLDTFKLDTAVHPDARTQQLVEEDPGSAAFTFYPNGEASGPDALGLLVAERPVSVRVDHLTGRATVEELPD